MTPDPIFLIITFSRLRWSPTSSMFSLTQYVICAEPSWLWGWPVIVSEWSLWSLVNNIQGLCPLLRKVHKPLIRSTEPYIPLLLLPWPCISLLSSTNECGSTSWSELYLPSSLKWVCFFSKIMPRFSNHVYSGYTSSLCVRNCALAFAKVQKLRWQLDHLLVNNSFYWGP